MKEAVATSVNERKILETANQTSSRASRRFRAIKCLYFF